jgi:hypothetical protein
MKVQDQVENILKVSGKARNSDRELLIIYMQKFGLELTERQEAKLRDMPAFETIRRVRQKLQEEGKYPASKEVEEARYNKYKNVKHNIQYENPEVLLEQQGYKVLPWGQ